MTSVAFIPARIGSKRFPRKNLATFGPEKLPLVAHAALTARGAQLCGALDRVVVSTDSYEVEAAARPTGHEDCEVAYRPDAARGYDLRVIDVLRLWLEAEPEAARPDLVCVLLPTSPLRMVRHIIESRLLMESDVDVVLSITPFRQNPRYALTVGVDRSVQIKGVADAEPRWKHDGTLAWLRTERVLAGHGFYDGSVRAYVVAGDESADVDDPLGLAWAEFLLARR